jgi:hypothetical protein
MTNHLSDDELLKMGMVFVDGEYLPLNYADLLDSKKIPDFRHRKSSVTVQKSNRKYHAKHNYIHKKYGPSISRIEYGLPDFVQIFLDEQERYMDILLDL